MKPARLPLALLVALAAAIWVAAWLGIQWRGAESELGRQAEAYEIDKAGLQRAHAVEARDLRGQLELTQRRLAAMGIHSTPVVVVTGTTGPVGGPGPAFAASDHVAPAPAPGSPSLPSGGGPCLYREGQKGQIDASGGAVLTDAGNVVVTGQADAYALGDPPPAASGLSTPRRHLFGGPLTLNAQYAGKPGQRDRGPSLGIGATVVGGRDGFSVGPAIAAPPLRLLGLQVEPSAAFTLGSGGQWAATGTILVRRAR